MGSTACEHVYHDRGAVQVNPAHSLADPGFVMLWPHISSTKLLAFLE